VTVIRDTPEMAELVPVNERVIISAIKQLSDRTK